MNNVIKKDEGISDFGGVVITFISAFFQFTMSFCSMDANPSKLTFVCRHGEVFFLIFPASILLGLVLTVNLFGNFLPGKLKQWMVSIQALILMVVIFNI